MMCKSNDENGSVLMEFIVVLPLYMLLLGFAFVIGDLSLDTIHLAGSGDRTRAFSSEDYDLKNKDGEADYHFPFDGYKFAASPEKDAWENHKIEFSYNGDPDLGSSVKVSEYDGNADGEGRRTGSRVYVADGGIQGPWIEMTAGVVVDDYTLPPLTRGLVAYWYRQNYETTDGTTQVGGPVHDMLSSGGSSRTVVEGKDLHQIPGKGESEKRMFGFYTLRRLVKRDWDENPRLTYRTWGNGQLSGADELWKKVADPGKYPDDAEKFPYGDNAIRYAKIDYDDDHRGTSPKSWNGTDAETDVRNDKFLSWSN